MVLKESFKWNQVWIRARDGAWRDTTSLLTCNVHTFTWEDVTEKFSDPGRQIFGSDLSARTLQPYGPYIICSSTWAVPNLKHIVK